MKVFVTGASGWVGSAVVDELLRAGHAVTGLVRTDKKAEAVYAAGAQVVRGTLDDLDTLRTAAASADAVVHTAFNHEAFNGDFSKFAEAAEQDRRAIETLGAALEGSQRPLLVTSGLAGMARGASESEAPRPGFPRQSEQAANAARERGARVATVRLAPSVHGIGDYGFVPMLIRAARRHGVSAYIGAGENCWSGVHRRDAARVYRLALEHGATQTAYHAVADEAVPFKAIAETIGRRLGLPVQSREREHFEWFAHMAGGDMAVSSRRTREVLGWAPMGAGLLADIDQPAYYAG
ncbi:SDR family oxidoreductase [Pseudomonas sp. CGJS7]|uniref:SDR family oxidoreductase n=1 Tax=Pseudomonas sp. CGJS7 TaxID=3109348 RepID=UPI003007F27A